MPETAIDCRYLVRPGDAADLARRATRETGDDPDKSAAHAVARKRLKHLDSLQERLYASDGHAVLVIFQAIDAGGKDSTIRFVFRGVNPQGCVVHSFKQPTPRERSHDFLWRHHAAVPPRGMIGIHNRSHYEAVLVERVQKIAPEPVWRARFDHINAFEKMLSDEGTVILKFFLHLGKKEQARRFRRRLDRPDKHWKFSPHDLAERERWDDYRAAFEEAITRCSTPHAPWYVIPADYKPYRNVVVSNLLVQTLENLDLRFPAAEEDFSAYRDRLD